VKSAACNHASGDLSAPRNAKETSEKQKNERPRLGENLFRTTWTAVVQPAATSTHKCGKTFGGRNHGCVLQCEADERNFLRNMYVHERFRSCGSAALRLQLEFRGCKFAYGQKRTQSNEIPYREDNVCRCFFLGDRAPRQSLFCSET
jgi:hypothetical protein